VRATTTPVAKLLTDISKRVPSVNVTCDVKVRRRAYTSSSAEINVSLIVTGAIGRRRRLQMKAGCF
jgi:hypothetical protein